MSRQVSAVEVVVRESADGIQKYTAHVRTDGEIASVAPGALESHFEVADGGVGTGFVVARAIDFTGEAPEVTEPTTLFSLRFAEPLSVDDVDLTVQALVDHAGENVPTEQVAFRAIE